MAATLFFKRLVSRHNLCRSFCQVTHIGVSRVPVDSQAQPCPDMRVDDSWTRKAPFENDLIGDGGNSSSGPALMRDLKESTADKECEEEYNLPCHLLTLMIKRVYAPDCVFVYLYVEGPGPPSQIILNYNLIRLLRHKLKPRIARSFIAQMLIRGTVPDLYTFQLVIDAYCKQLTYQHVLDLVFTQMKALGVKADVSFYKILMDGVCARFGPDVGFHLLKKLRSSHQVQMPLFCYDAVVRQFHKRKMTDDAVLLLIDVLVDMKQQRVFPDEKFYNFLLKVHGYGCECSLKTVGIGRQMFAQSIRTGAVYPKPDRDMWKGTLK